MAERALRQSLGMFLGNDNIFSTRPIRAGLLLAPAMRLWPLIGSIGQRRRRQAAGRRRAERAAAVTTG